MVKYSSDTNLIRGAGQAYRDYSNAPGIYAGLDKISEASERMTDKAISAAEKQAERIKKEEEEAKAKKAKQDSDWWNISGNVYANAGSFMKDVEYKNTAASISALKEKYIAAQESGDSEEMAAVMIEFNNIKKGVDGHKAFRETITDPEYGISSAMKYAVDANGDALPEGDNGEDHNFLIGLTKEEYTITTEDGKKYYNVGGVKKTMDEIQDMTILKDFKPFNDYGKALDTFGEAKDYDRDRGEYHIRNNVLPKDIKGLRAFMADDGFGNGETFLQLLNKKGNRSSIEGELLNSVFNMDGGDISDTEWENFTNAIIDPKNKFWKTNGGDQAWEKNARIIATEQLANGIDNRRKNNETSEGIAVGSAEWKRIMDVQLAQRKFNASQNPENNYQNRTEEFDLFTSPNESRKVKTTSNELINLDNRLGNFMQQQSSSFDTEAYVDVFGNRVGYFPGKGFAPVRLATREDVKNGEFNEALGRPIKVGEIIRKEPGSDVAYWKTPTDVFANYSIPTTYNRQNRPVKGDKRNIKGGGTATFNGVNWIED